MANNGIPVRVHPDFERALSKIELNKRMKDPSIPKSELSPKKITEKLIHLPSWEKIMNEAVGDLDKKQKGEFDLRR